MRKIKLFLYKIYFFFKNTLKFDKVNAFISEVFYSFRINRCTKTAASLIYYTLITVVPFLALFLPILNMLGTTQLFYDMLERFFASIGGVRNAENIISSLSEYLKNSKSLGVVSMIVFFYSSLLLINNIYVSINNIYRTPTIHDRQNIFRRFFSYIVFLIVFIVVASIFVFSRDKVIAVLDSEISGFSFAWLYRLLSSKIFNVCLTFCVFFFSILLIPQVYVKPLYASIGALISTCGIYFLTFLLSTFVSVLFRKSSVIYGSVSSVFVFLFWLYYSWIIVLLSITVSYVAQYRPEKNKETSRTMETEIRDMISLIKTIASSFVASKGGVSLASLSEKLHISSYEVIKMADKYVNAGIIYPIGKMKKRQYSMALPPEKISINFLLSIILGKTETGVESEPVLAEIYSLLADNFSTSTLAEKL